MNQKKSKYLKPQIEIAQIETEDVLTASVEDIEVPEEPGINLPVDQFEP